MATEGNISFGKEEMQMNREKIIPENLLRHRRTLFLHVSSASIFHTISVLCLFVCAQDRQDRDAGKLRVAARKK